MSVVSRILEKKGKEAISRVKDFFSGEPERERPREYPLGLRLDALVRFDPTDFILAGDNLKIELPAGDLAIMGIGEFRCLGIHIYRFYLKNLADDEWVLQVADDETDREVVLYQTLDEVFPEDWAFWLNDQTGLIGFKDFHTPDQVDYYRMFHTPGPDHAAPIEFRERITGSGTIFYVDHAMMLYGRNVPMPGDEKLTEYLLVSKEVDEEGAMVRISAGVPLNPMSLKVM